jgi:hypothetical protein
MRIFPFIAFGLLLLTLLISCKTDKKQQLPAGPVSMENRTVQQKKGTDCDKQPDSLRTDCAIIDFSVPKVQVAGAQSALAKNLDAWVDKFLIHLLTWTDYPESDPSKVQKNLDAAIQRFRAIHDEAAGSVSSGQFVASCKNNILLNDGKYLTVQMDGHSFQGGNRALEKAAIGTFDYFTGKLLTWEDLAKDQAYLRSLAQTKVREARADVFKEGFEFDPTEKFSLPEAFGLTSKGLLFHYNDQEIYRLGGVTEFVVPYDQIGDKLKMTPPVSTAGEMEEEKVDLYETVGDMLVIPPFEIEVRTSAKASKTLKNKKESIIVSALFSGIPKDEKDENEIGTMIVLDTALELTGNNRIARFQGLKFSKKLLDKLADKDVSMLINIFSGRKSSKDNLLSCGLVEVKASQFTNKRYSLSCSLIEESIDGKSLPPLACYALPAEAEAPSGQFFLSVDCSERGEIFWAGEPARDLEELKSKLRPVLQDLRKSGSKELPGIQTSGCLMGMSGAIRDMYEELKSELTNNGKTPKPEEYSAGTGEVKSTDKAKTTKFADKSKPADKTKPATKPAAAGESTPVITLNQKGEITLNGKKIKLENLRKDLQAALLTQAVIPDKLELKTIGETAMGMRSEVNTVINESIAGAKWAHKKAAIDALTASVGRKLGIPASLQLNTYQTSGSFAFIDAKPLQKDGKAIDYTKTTEKKKGKMVDRVLGLLQYDKGAWKVLTYNLETNTVPVDAWVKTYKAPKALFEKGK